MNDTKVEESTLEFDQRLKPTIINGCKTTTLRKGHRYFKRNITIAKQPAIVNGFRHYILSTVPLEILVREGFLSIFDAIRKLQRYYPDINLNTPVTVIEFRMDVLYESSTHPVDRATKDWLK
jgi:hypothetical protein